MPDAPANAPKPTKRGRGRPKFQVADFQLPILEGNTKMEKLQTLYNSWFNCTRCPLGPLRLEMTGKEDIVFGHGNPDADVMIIGEAPGEEEERTGIPFVGPSGNILDLFLADIADDDHIQALSDWYGKAPRNKANEEAFHTQVREWRDKNFFITNVISCRPPENRTPVHTEIKTCWERLWTMIYTVDPKLIIAVGKTASQAATKKAQFEITKYRGQIFDATHIGRIGPVKYAVMPVFHPSYLIRKADYKQKGGDFEKTREDFRSAMQTLDLYREKHHGTPIPRRWKR